MFGPELAIQAPDWLGDPATRHATVPKGMRWMPTTSFFQVLVDMKNSANVVPGVFAAKGHDYRADLLPFFHGVLGLPATPEQLEAIHRRLEERELLRSQWAKDHKSSDKGLAAEVLARLDPRGTRSRPRHRRTPARARPRRRDRGVRRERRCRVRVVVATLDPPTKGHDA